MSDDAQISRLRELAGQRERLVNEYYSYPEGSNQREIVLRGIHRIDAELEERAGSIANVPQTIDRMERNKAIDQGCGGMGCGLVAALIGGGWSLWSYFSAGPGETYTILWGLIVFGAVIFGGGLLRVIAARR